MDPNLIANIEDQIEILTLRIQKLRNQFDQLDLVKETHDRKKTLEGIIRDIQRANSDIKNMQYEIKRVPKMKEVELNEKLNKLRQIVNELEENLNEKKRKFKYEIRLANELDQLKNIEELDPENVDLELIEEIGIQLPKEDSIAIDKLKEQIKQNQQKHLKVPPLGSINDVKIDGPIISQSGRSYNEQELEKKKNQPMVIDLELQKIDNSCRRLGQAIKVFWHEYIKDWFTCLLMLLFIAAVIFAIIAAIMTDKTKIVPVPPVPVKKLM
eukprot:403341733